MRRRLRKQRAVARKQWYLHRRGFIQLTSNRLQRLLVVLSSHHSRDPIFLREIQRAIMSKKPAKNSGKLVDPWRCTRCWTTARKGAEFCARCGADAKSFADPTYLPPGATSAHSWDQWTSYGWDQTQADAWTWNAQDWQKPKSPRKERSTSRKQKGKKGQGKGKPSPKAAEPWQDVGPPTSTAPSMPMPQLPAIVAHTATTTTSASSSSAAELKLQELAAALKKQPDSLSPEVQALVKEVAADTGKKTTDQAVEAVQELGAAKDHLTALKWARYQSHGRWKVFLKEATDLWMGYTTAFKEQELMMIDAIAKARQAVREASARSTAMKQEVEEISDGEGDVEVNEAQVTSMQEGMAQMSDALSNLHREAEALHSDEKAPKRKRLDASGNAVGSGLNESPFHTPGS